MIERQQSAASRILAAVASANVELVRSIYASLERGDPNPADWAHPEIEFVFADGPSPGTWTGVAGMIEAWRDYMDIWEEYYSQPDEIRELDDERVLVFDTVHGRAKASGVDISQISPKGADLFHIRNGRVTRLVLYFDQERALADLGLAPKASSQDS
jgi:ketosteroid isomerase-like protein